jgi:endonuclease YncB( thermonuclease family)
MKNTKHIWKTKRHSKNFKICSLRYTQKLMNKTNLGWKYLLTASLICSSSFAAEPSKPVKAVVTYVIDGDTVAIEAKWIPLPMKPVIAVRVYGVDTPEKSYRAKCESEAALGEKASEFTKGLIAQAKRIEVSYYSWDKYGGRVLGDLLLDKKSLRASLINNGFAREYYGDAKQSWCE